MNIILSGGGTAGHITPAISIYDHLKKLGHNPRLVVAARDYNLIPAHYDYNYLEKIPKYWLGNSVIKQTEHKILCAVDVVTLDNCFTD